MKLVEQLISASGTPSYVPAHSLSAGENTTICFYSSKRRQTVETLLSGPRGSYPLKIRPLQINHEAILRTMWIE